MNTYFVTAIHTDSGKTLVSTLLTIALKADYWKPVQTGQITDSDQVKKWLGEAQNQRIHKEAYHLQAPMSPHAAAALENQTIEMEQICLPQTNNKHLVIEGAGGLLVPLNEKNYIIDLAKKFESKIILVANIYLGSINHTMLSIELLKQKKIPIEGLIFNGEALNSTTDFITEKANAHWVFHLPKIEKITNNEIIKYSNELQKKII